jgi:hypothetical protein
LNVIASNHRAIDILHCNIRIPDRAGTTPTAPEARQNHMRIVGRKTFQDIALPY